MVDLDRGKIIRDGKEETIARFEVWWMTPWGLASSYQEMCEYLRDKELEAPLNFIVTPITVAIGETLNETMVSTK